MPPKLAANLSWIVCDDYFPRWLIHKSQTHDILSPTNEQPNKQTKFLMTSNNYWNFIFDFLQWKRVSTFSETDNYKLELEMQNEVEQTNKLFNSIEQLLKFHSYNGKQ